MKHKPATSTALRQTVSRSKGEIAYVRGVLVTHPNDCPSTQLCPKKKRGEDPEISAKATALQKESVELERYRIDLEKYAADLNKWAEGYRADMERKYNELRGQCEEMREKFESWISKLQDQLRAGKPPRV